ncbi:hypothetical protein FIBSPDRAFT_864672 [Athelia psychrophila]|uniref:Uncharacterized protein n=1 Tax=Athelia psychrophila TaxID=1759441 RepID=A0A166GC21_9AGAM|nr:hypothetical protein FIBSPDRAFT_864672 [Fibularhizoctonia sp. CBS 109695]
MSTTSTIQSPCPIIAVRMLFMHTPSVSYLTSVTVFEEALRAGTGDQRWGEAEGGRGAWEETEGTARSLWHRLLRAFGCG